jgi:hypothetical protein
MAVSLVRRVAEVLILAAAITSAASADTPPALQATSQRYLPTKPGRSVNTGAAGVAVQKYSASGKMLLAQSHVNVLAPTRVPASWGSNTYPTVQPLKDYRRNVQVGYDVVLGGPGCTGATACTQADVYGEKVPPTEQTRLDGKIVATKLADGAPAKYVSGPCGANCAGSFKLQFVKGGYAYTISIKGGTLADGLLIAQYLRPVASLP